MTLKELRDKIDNKKYNGGPLLIFNLNKNQSIIPSQYISKIIEICDFRVEYVEDLDTVGFGYNDLFEDEDIQKTLYVHHCNELTYTNKNLASMENFIIVANTISNESAKIFKDCIISVPELESWQIQDYVYSILNGTDTASLDTLISICGNDIFRLNCEIEKLKLFPANERPSMLKQFIKDGIYSDISQYTIFQLSDAIGKRDIEKIKNIRAQLDLLDITEMQLLGTFIKTFRNIILTQLQSVVTESTTGIPSKQLWALKHVPKVYSKEKLIDIYKLLTSIDMRIKSGELPSDITIDYMIIKILQE